MTQSKLHQDALQHFILFNSVLFLFQLYVIYQLIGGYLMTVNVPFGVVWEIMATLLIQFYLYLVLALLQTWLYQAFSQSWLCQSPSQGQILIWIVTTLTILTANYYFFPRSAINHLMTTLLSAKQLHVLFYLSLTLLAALIINALLRLERRQKIILTATALFLILATVLPHPARVKANSRPSVILIGIDSLVPGNVDAKLMPFLSSQLKQSSQFNQTISPLGRTYAAWAALLTGLYPQNNGARDNMTPKALVKSELSIAWQLQKQGFYTLFATDSRRFNNLGEEFGFNRLIGSKSGANNFILGNYNDFPLGNLLHLSELSQALFPYNYLNRESTFLYHPHWFNRALDKALRQTPANAPLFLASHFTLPHWPYYWAPLSPYDNQIHSLYNKNQYRLALTAVDQQVKEFYQALDNHHLLDNSLVIFFSDHGETFKLKHSRPLSMREYQGQGDSQLQHYFQTETDTQLDESVGHGSDVLSPNQFNCLMAIQLFQQHRLRSLAQQIGQGVSLLDIKPTIQAYLNLSKQSVDGVSLLETLKTGINPPDRGLFIESGMFPNRELDEEAGKRYGRMYLQVNPVSYELEIKDNAIRQFNQEKLYACIQGDWLLALYPAKNQTIQVLMNLKNFQWTDDPQSAFFRESPALGMLKRLRSFQRGKTSPPKSGLPQFGQKNYKLRQPSG